MKGIFKIVRGVLRRSGDCGINGCRRYPVYRARRERQNFFLRDLRVRAGGLGCGNIVVFSSAENRGGCADSRVRVLRRGSRSASHACARNAFRYMERSDFCRRKRRHGERVPRGVRRRNYCGCRLRFSRARTGDKQRITTLKYVYTERL